MTSDNSSQHAARLAVLRLLMGASMPKRSKQADKVARFLEARDIVVAQALQVASNSERGGRRGVTLAKRRIAKDQAWKQIRGRVVATSDGKPVIVEVPFRVDTDEVLEHFILAGQKGQEQPIQLPTARIIGRVTLTDPKTLERETFTVEPHMTFNGIGGRFPIVEQSGRDWTACDLGLNALYDLAWSKGTHQCILLEPNERDGKTMGRQRAVLLAWASPEAIKVYNMCLKALGQKIIEESGFKSITPMLHSWFEGTPAILLKPVGYPGIPFYFRAAHARKQNPEPGYQDVLGLTMRGTRMRIAESDVEPSADGDAGFPLHAWEIQPGEGDDKLLCLGKASEVAKAVGNNPTMTEQFKLHSIRFLAKLALCEKEMKGRPTVKSIIGESGGARRLQRQIARTSGSCTMASWICKKLGITEAGLEDEGLRLIRNDVLERLAGFELKIEAGESKPAGRKKRRPHRKAKKRTAPKENNPVVAVTQSDTPQTSESSTTPATPPIGEANGQEATTPA
jgi:hypothetical protein